MAFVSGTGPPALPSPMAQPAWQARRRQGREQPGIPIVRADEVAPTTGARAGRGPAATVARIKAIVMEPSIPEPWHPANVERITGSGWFVRLPSERRQRTTADARARERDGDGDDADDEMPHAWASAPRYLVTCNHCVEGVRARDGIVVETSSTGDALLRARVAVAVPEIDLAVVEVLPTGGVDPRALVAWDLGDDRDGLAMGDAVHVYGYPLGQDRLKGSESRVNGREAGLLQLDGSINFGDSGGPVVRDGLVVGWITKGVPEANAVSFAQPVSLLLAVLYALCPAPALRAADWRPFGGLPPPARVMRRGGLGVVRYAATDDRLVAMGARCPGADDGGGSGDGAAAPFAISNGRVVHNGDPAASVNGAPSRRILSRTRLLAGGQDGVGGPGMAARPPGRARGCDCPSGVVVQWVSDRSDLAAPPFETEPGDVVCTLVLPMVPPGGYADLLRSSWAPPLACEAGDGTGAAAAPPLGSLVGIEVPVANDGAVVLPWTDDRMDMERALMFVPWGVPVGVRLYKARQGLAVFGWVRPITPRPGDGFYRPYRPFEPVDYEAFGGIVVGPATADVIEAVPGLAARLGPAARDRPRLAVLRSLVGGPINAGPADDTEANVRESDIVERVNGRPVRTLDEYRAALRSPYGGAYLAVETDRGRGDVVSMASVLAAEPDLASQYGYPLSDTWSYYHAAVAGR
jgi:S1-C subfamily serine protease